MVAFLLMIIFIVIAVVFMHLFAKLTMVIQKNKGYKEEYWIGFVFGPLAWFYCFVLPDLKTQKAIKELSEKLNKEE